MGAIISSHNKSVLNPRKRVSGCNCQNRSECPFDNKCLTPQSVYLGEVTNDIDDEKKFYIGISEPPWKIRWKNHCRDFTHVRYRTSTKISEYVWDLKDSGKTPSIKWSCLKKVSGRARSNYCRLCLEEKLHILEFDNQDNLLNKRSEFINCCRHQRKYLISNAHKFDSND